MRQERRAVKAQQAIETELKGYKARESSFVDAGLVRSAGHSSAGGAEAGAEMLAKAVSIVGSGVDLYATSQTMGKKRRADTAAEAAKVKAQEKTHAISVEGQAQSAVQEEAFRRMTAGMDDTFVRTTGVTNDLAANNANAYTYGQEYSQSLSDFLDFSGLNDYQKERFASYALKKKQDLLQQEQTKQNAIREEYRLNQIRNSLLGINLRDVPETGKNVGIDRTEVKKVLGQSTNNTLTDIELNAPADYEQYKKVRAAVTLAGRVAGSLETSLESASQIPHLKALLEGQTEEEQRETIVRFTMKQMGVLSPLQQVNELLFDFESTKVEGLPFSETDEGRVLLEDIHKLRGIVMSQERVDKVGAMKAPSPSQMAALTPAETAMLVATRSEEVAVILNPTALAQDAGEALNKLGNFYSRLSPTHQKEMSSAARTNITNEYESLRNNLDEGGLDGRNMFNTYLNRLLSIKQGGGALAKDIFAKGEIGKVLTMMQVVPDAHTVVGLLNKYEGKTINDIIGETSGEGGDNEKAVSRIANKLRQDVRKVGFGTVEDVESIVWMALATYGVGDTVGANVKKFANELFTTVVSSTADIRRNTLTTEITIPTSMKGLIGLVDAREVMSTFVNETYRDGLVAAGLLKEGRGLANGLNVDSIKIVPAGLRRGVYNIVFTEDENRTVFTINEKDILDSATATEVRRDEEEARHHPLMYWGLEAAKSAFPGGRTSTSRIYE